MNDMRAIDGNGYVPAEESAEACCNECLREDPAYKLGRQEAILDMIGVIAKQAEAQLSQIIETLQRPAA